MYMERCRMFARACSAAIVLDTYSPRPGLSTVGRWRRDPGPLAFSLLSGYAYELCLRACTRGMEAARTPAAGGVATRPWAWLVESLARLGLGNPGFGSTFLLALQAASLGYSVEAYGSDCLDHVKGAHNVV